MRLVDRLFGGRSAQRDGTITLEQYAQQLSQFTYNGWTYPGGVRQTLAGNGTEKAPNNFEGLVTQAYQANGIVFACMLARMMVFSTIRFQWQRILNGKPSDTFGNRDLSIFEEPWPGGTTQDLLTRLIQDADLAGNWYGYAESTLATLGTQDPKRELVRLRPDWVQIVAVPRRINAGAKRNLPNPDGGQVGWRKIGYLYTENGGGSQNEAVPFLVDEIAHYAPIPDPLGAFIGMSWLTPVIREIAADQSMTRYKRRFMDNGASPNLVVRHFPGVPGSNGNPGLAGATEEAVESWIKKFDDKYSGIDRAGRTMHLYPGADVTVVGSNLKEIEFKVVQGAGEPLALDTSIPTPSGWTTMGEIQVGDEVIGRDGLPAKVVGVSPVHHGRDCYRVTFNDRTSIVADAGHLWVAMDRATRARSEKTYTTGDLAGLIEDWRDRELGGNRMGVPVAAAAKLPDRDLLVDPYVLGVWLGDGQTAGAAVCGAEADLPFIADEIRRRGYSVTEWSTKPGKVSVIGLPGGFLAALDALGVLGDKHIPQDYLRASEQQRLELLRGLMDTDGTVGSRGSETCEFSSKDEALARQFADLSRSLGQRTTVSRKVEPRSRTGETWRVTFRADPDMVPFRMPRKVARCVTPLHVRNRAIVSVEPVESVPVRCIAVDTPDHLFCAGEGWVLTHNTRIAAAAGVPPIIVGLSEGLESATYSNYSSARRRFADGTIHPLWKNAAGSLQRLVPRPDDYVRLWYDTSDVEFLREDEKDAAEIADLQAKTIRTYIDGGFEPASVIAAVEANDRRLLTHTGWFSVQLQQPGAQQAVAAAARFIRELRGAGEPALRIAAELEQLALPAPTKEDK